MSDEIKPALTAEEWWEVLGWPQRVRDKMMGAAVYGADLADIGEPKQRHALAALCLHDQPFGFSREQVGALRDVLDWHVAGDCGPYGEEFMSEELKKSVERLRDLADRIEALLPPEGKTA